MTKNVPYNLRYLAKSVFKLEPVPEKILKLIATQHERTGSNQTRIARSLKNSDNAATRRTVKKKIFGTNKTKGLIPMGYVVQKQENKYRYKKQESTFHLTFKGMFGALAAGVSLKNISIYKNFLKTIDYFVDDNNIRYVLKQFYESQIHVFLLWHHLNGIQLTETMFFTSYFVSFLKNEFRHTHDFGILLNHELVRTYHKPKHAELSEIEKLEIEKTKQYVEEILKAFTDYFCLKGLIDLLRKSGKIPTQNTLQQPDERKEKYETREGVIFDNLIDSWSIYMESVYRTNNFDEAMFAEYSGISDVSNVKFLSQHLQTDVVRGGKRKTNPLKTVKQIEIDFNIVYIPTIEEKIKRIIKEKNLNLTIPQNRPANVYSF